MSMVCGLDLHRQQITFDALETVSGEVWRGRVWQPDRERFRRWLRHDVAGRANGEPVTMAVEGCTGWRYVAEEIVAAGFEVHVAEPADTQAARGNKHRAKTDRSDARLLRELLQRGELPESWVPPTVVLEWRERVRLYKSLLDQRRVWIQRIHAELFQHGVAVPQAEIGTPATRTRLASDEVILTAAARQRIAVSYAMIDATDAHLVPLRAQLQRFARRQPACRALIEAHYGIGALTAVAVWSELGDCRRFTRSLQAVRHSGLDVVVDSSDQHRAGGYLSRQGPAHAALGAVRSRHVRLPAPQPRPRLLHDGEAASRRQAGGDLRRPPVGPPLLPHVAQPRPRSGVRHPGLNPAGDDGPGRSPQHHESLPRSAPATGVPASLRAGRPYNNDATALPTGDIQIPIVVADDIDVRRAPRKRRAPPRRRQPAHSQCAPALGLVKVVRPRFAAGAPP